MNPQFRYQQETHTDEFCDIVDLFWEIAMSYLVQTIKQSYKVIFSMQLLGDPSYVLHQYKTGVREFFTKTRDEIAAGGKDGAGKGVSSLLQNVVGGTAFMFGKISGGAADTVS